MLTIVEKILAGNVNAVAQTIRSIEDERPGISKILKELYPYTGRAYIIGVTGAPGVGKSTLVDQMLLHLRQQDKTVGVIAVDPTSPFCGGSFLGDRVRMQQHNTDDGVFIRSMATRGNFGGLSLSTKSSIDVLDAMGKDCIIVETVGVGQVEMDIARYAHTTIIVFTPGMGDEIQSFKSGILEIGDIFVINKAEMPGVDQAFKHLMSRIELEFIKEGQDQWAPPVLKTQAISNNGIDQLLREVEKHADYLATLKSGLYFRRNRENVSHELKNMLKNQLFKTMYEQLVKNGEFDRIVESIISGKIDPYSAVDSIIMHKLGGKDI